MGLSVQTNNSAMTALKYLNSNSKAMDKSLERLPSGFRANNAADDASGSFQVGADNDVNNRVSLDLSNSYTNKHTATP